MSPDIIAGVFAQIVSLMADFHAHRASEEAATLEEFQEYLRAIHHEELLYQLQQSDRTLISIKVLLTQHSGLFRSSLEAIGRNLESVRSHLGVPDESDGSAARRELVCTALTMVALTCHYWKIFFMNILHSTQGAIPDGGAGEYADVWDLMETEWIPAYTPVNFRAFRPLFCEAIEDLHRRFDRAILRFHHVLPDEIQSDVATWDLQLEAEQTTYDLVPALVNTAGNASPIDPDLWFRQRFVGVIRALRDLDRKSRKLEGALRLS